MPGKGAVRSRSSPRERPPSPMGGRPQTSNQSSFGASGGINTFSRTIHTPSPRAGTPPGPRKLNTLNLSGVSSGCESDRNHDHHCSASTFNQENCICGICTCGRHKCPVQSKTSIFYGGNSEFATTSTDAFVPHDSKHYQPTKATRGQQVYTPGEPFDHTTTNQATFLWHERERPSSRSSSRMERSTPGMMTHSNPLGSDARMDLTTSYGSQFVEHAMPTKSAKPAQATYSYGSPREMLTTKQLDYTGLQPTRCPATVLPSRQPSARSGHTKYNMDLTGTWR